MKAFREYWTFSAIRGAMTLLASIAIVTLPYVTASALSMPVLIGLAIDCWATYMVLDAAVIVLLAKMLPARARNLSALYWQALMNVCVAGTLYLIVYGVIDLRWAVGIATFQAGFAAVVEWRVARQTHGEYSCLSCYSTAIALAFSAVCLPFAMGLDGSNAPLAVAAFVGLYGMCELSLGGRMLFIEYRAGHPAAMASQAWRLEKFATAKRAACARCDECPANAMCMDESLAGEVARLNADRLPPIVQTVRIAAFLKSVA
jgi:hypothetical protein